MEKRLLDVVEVEGLATRVSPERGLGLLLQRWAKARLKESSAKSVTSTIILSRRYG
jgi:hypothetical protein